MFQETYPIDRFPDAIEAEGGMAGTQDVADQIGCSYELAYKRLCRLEDNGTIASQKIGNARLWILASPRGPEPTTSGPYDPIAEFGQ